MEAFDEKHLIHTDPDHYEPIAAKVPTSIPQIRRDFTARFQNGARYLKAAGRQFDQPTHYARKIMELQELYEDAVLDEFIGIAVDKGMMDIRSFRAMLREYNSGQHAAVDKAGSLDTESLTRNCGSMSILWTKRE